MSDRKTILKNIQKLVDDSNIVKCYFEQHYLRPKDMNNTKIMHDCDKHVHCFEKTYSLLKRKDMYLMKTNQWHTITNSSDFNAIILQWFNVNGKLSQHKNSLTFIDYLQHPK